MTSFKKKLKYKVINKILVKSARQFHKVSSQNEFARKVLLGE